MNRFTYRPTLASMTIAATMAMACGTSVTTGNPDTGSGGAGGSDLDCSLDPPGDTFTFTITNTGDRGLRLAYGCGANLPIEVATDAGTQGISPGAVNSCEIGCESVYDGNGYQCSDCGPGVGDALLPGQTVTIEWDRRIYVAHAPEPTCTGNADGNICALGVSVGAAEVTSGILEVCVAPLPQYITGYCSDDNRVQVPFSVDLTLDNVTVEVQ
jgi:hypothetical protein